MSRIIKITRQTAAEIIEDFKAALLGSKLADGKINFTKTFGTINRKAKIFFTEMAWLKMQTLVREFDKEVAWHGVARRGEDESKDEYFITDILVYPQEVSSATVNTDQKEYETWLMEKDDDVFNNIRMQGHSHVNMSTSPSGVDLTHQESILEQLNDDMFYIFMIWNKKGDKTIKIYDMKKNTLFETGDVTVEVIDDGTGLEAFLKEAKKMVKNKVYTTPVSQYSGGYGGHYGYGSYYQNQNKQSKVEPKNENSKQQTTSPSASNVVPIPSTGRKGKRKGKKKGKSTCGDKQTSFMGFSYDDDDLNDPFYSMGT